MVSFFLGLTMALLTGYQLEKFGTERLVPTVISIAFTRELGPLLTGIVLAARIGAAYTAELGTMQVSEEVEAIEAMGIGPLRFLVAPRLVAIASLMPCLSVLSVVAALIGSALISWAALNLVPDAYFDAVVTSSISEANALPVMEAAAAGRLVIGTPVGNFPRNAYEGAGIIAPIEPDKFKEFTAATLRYYKDNPTEFVRKCQDIQKAATKLDWKHMIGDWIELIEASR